METYYQSPQSQRLIRETIVQSGNGIGRYVYNHSMEGNGVGGFFAKLFKTVLPLARKGINTVVKVAKPHLRNLGNDLVSSAQKEAFKQINKAASSSKRKRDNLDHE